jgi:hypothetical protein
MERDGGQRTPPDNFQLALTTGFGLLSVPDFQGHDGLSVTAATMQRFNVSTI